MITYKYDSAITSMYCIKASRVYSRDGRHLKTVKKITYLHQDSNMNYANIISFFSSSSSLLNPLLPSK